MTHKIFDKIDRMVMEKRSRGEFDAWIATGAGKRYCQRVAGKGHPLYPALLLYLERLEAHN